MQLLCENYTSLSYLGEETYVKWECFSKDNICVCSTVNAVPCSHSYTVT